MGGVRKKTKSGYLTYAGSFADGNRFRIRYDVESGRIWLRADANTSVHPRKGQFAVLQPATGNVVVREFIQAGAVYTLSAKFRKCLSVPASGGSYDLFDLLTNYELYRDGVRVGLNRSDVRLYILPLEVDWVHVVADCSSVFVVDSRGKEIGPVRRCGVSVRLVVSPEVAGGEPLIEEFRCAFVVRQQENEMCESPLHFEYCGPHVWPCGGGCINLADHLEWWYFREWTSRETERVFEEGRLSFRRMSISDGWSLSESGIVCTEGNRVYGTLHVEVSLDIPSRLVRYVHKELKGRQTEVYKVRTIGNYVVSPDQLLEVLPGGEFKVFSGDSNYVVTDSAVLHLVLHPSMCAFVGFRLADGVDFSTMKKQPFKVFMGTPTCTLPEYEDNVDCGCGGADVNPHD